MTDSRRIERLDDWREGRERRIHRAILMQSTTPERARVVRELARLVSESGAAAGELGWECLLFPTADPATLMSVEGRPTPAGDCLTKLLEANREVGVRWAVRLRGLTRPVSRAIEVLAHYVGGSFVATLAEDLIPRAAPASEPMPYLLEVLRAFRWCGFTGRAEVGPVLARSAPPAPDGTLGRRYREVLERLDADLEVLADAVLELGDELTTAGRLEESAAACEAAYEVAVFLLDSSRGIEAARRVGRAHRRAGAWDDAARWYQVAERLAAFEEDWGRLAVVLDGVANLHADRGAIPRARETYARAIGLADLAGDREARARLHHSSAGVAYWSEDFEDCLVEAWKSVELHTEHERQAGALVLVGSALSALGQPARALDAYLAAVQLAEAEDTRAYGLVGVAWCEALMGRTEEYARADQRVRAYEARISPRARVQALLHRAKSLCALGDLEGKRQACLETIAFAEARGYTRELVLAEELMQKRERRPDRTPLGPDGSEAAAGARRLRETVVA